MIHMHGTPIAGDNEAVARVLQGRAAFISFAEPKQLEIAQEVCSVLGGDNGAFSFWKNGRTPASWDSYYRWSEDFLYHPAALFVVIPDVIDGGEEENDDLLEEWPHGDRGAPVWHLHDSLDRLERLVQSWPRVCFGSSGEYATVGTQRWWDRMAEAMTVACDEQGRPRARLHGLRMLNPEIFTRFPFASADSTNVGRNLGIDQRWQGPYAPPNRSWRGIILAERVEAFQSAARWEAPPLQHGLFAREA